MDDIYLNLAIELFEKGTWTKDVFIKRVTLYANEKGMDMNSINDMIDRVTKPKDFSVDEKRDILSKITIVGNELKYGDAARLMDDGDVVRFFEMEQNSLGIDKLTELLENNTKEIIEDNNIIEEVKPEEKKPSKIIINKKDIRVVKSPSKKEDLVVDLNTPVPALEDETKVEPVLNTIEEKKEPVLDLSSVFHVPEPIVEEPKVLNNLSVEDIVNNKYSLGDLLGKTSDDLDKNLDELAKNIEEKDVVRVSKAFEDRIGVAYAKKFNERWNKVHTLDNLEEKPVSKEEEIIKDDSSFVIPPISLEGFDEDLPKSEEGFTREAEKMNKPEKDSKVKVVDVSKERLARLKTNKQRIINSFLKTGVLVLAYSFMNPYLAVGATLGYMYFADAIRSGDFKANNPVTKALKWSVEKVMYLGKDKEEERGKTR